MIKRILFLDLDGTIIKTKSGEVFPIDGSDWQLIPQTCEFMSRMYNEGFDLCIATNQGGIAYGHTTAEKFISKFLDIAAKIEEEYGVPAKDIDLSYSSTPKTFYHKPNAGMLLAKCLNAQANPYDCLMVGDNQGNKKPTDAGAAVNAGMPFLHVDTIIGASDEKLNTLVTKIKDNVPRI